MLVSGGLNPWACSVTQWKCFFPSLISAATVSFLPFFFICHSEVTHMCANEDVDLLKMFNRTYVEVKLGIFLEHGVEFCCYLTCKSTGTSTCPKWWSNNILFCMEVFFYSSFLLRKQKKKIFTYFIAHTLNLLTFFNVKITIICKTAQAYWAWMKRICKCQFSSLARNSEFDFLLLLWLGHSAKFISSSFDQL